MAHRLIMLAALVGALTTQASSAPTADVVIPSSGSGDKGLFSFTFSSSAGVASLSTTYALFGVGASTTGNCVIEFLPASKRLYLYNDAGAGLLGPVVIGTTGLLQNSQCILDAAASAVVTNGNSLTLSLSLSFKAGFRQMQNVYGQAFDVAGASSGWKRLGTWYSGVLQGTPPTVDSVAPVTGYGNPATFQFQFSSVNGYSYLDVLYALIGSNTGAANACLVQYLPGSDRLYLYADRGASILGPIAPGSTSSLTNSQCTISGGGVAVSKSNTSITLRLSLSFSPGFAGARNIYGNSFDIAHNSSGWQTLGTWYTSSTINGTPGVPVGIAAASGTPQSVVVGTVLTQGLQVRVTDIIGNGVAGVTVSYQRPTSGSSIAFVNEIQTAVTDANGRASITGTANAAVGSYSVTASVTGVAAKATFNITNIPPPVSVVGVTPSSGTGSSQVFTAQYRASYAAALSSVGVLIGSSATTAQTCYVSYQVGSKVLYLVSDSGKTLLGGLAPGSNAVVSNSQCLVDMSSVSVSSSGLDITMSFSVAFTNYTGPKTIFLCAGGSSGPSTGFIPAGTWNSLPAPAVVGLSVTPNNGIGNVQRIASRFYAQNGSATIGMVTLLISSGLQQDHACSVSYAPGLNLLYLMDDGGIQKPPVAMGSNSSLANSQCIVDASTTKYALSGNIATLTVQVEFTAALSGSRNIYLAGASTISVGAFGSAVGSWTQGPSSVSVSPGNSTGSPQVFTATYSDPLGTGDLQWVGVVIAAQPQIAPACYTVYIPATNSVYLLSDSGGSLLGPIVPGASGTVSNSLCGIDARGVQIATSGNRLTMTLSVSFADKFTGAYNVYLLATDNGNHATGFVQLGTWTAPLQFYPQLAPTTTGVKVTTPAPTPTRIPDISATNDASPWLVDIGQCPSPPCFSVVQDSLVGSAISAKFLSSSAINQADVAAGAGNPRSFGQWDLSNKSSLEFYLKNTTTTLSDPRDKSSTMYHYFLMYDLNYCVRQWFISGQDITVGKWARITIENIKSGPFYYAGSCSFDYSRIGYIELGVFGPNLPTNNWVSFDFARFASY